MRNRFRRTCAIAILAKAALITGGALTLVAPEGAIGQSQASVGDARMARERALLDRIRSLEQQLAALRDVQARLAALEAKISTAPRVTNTSSLPTVATPGQAPGQTAANSDRAPDSAVGDVVPSSMAGPHNTTGKPQAAPDDAQTERERALLQRIRSLEAQLEDLRAVEARLAALEARISSTPPAESAGSSPQAAPQPASGQTAAAPDETSDQGGYQEPLMWGEWNPGPGFKVANTEVGDLNLSGYMVARYLNQLPPTQSATDHLGRPLPVRPRQDFQFHRVMLYASGWLFDPKFRYFTFVWTVNDVAQVAVGGALSYDFNKRFSLGLGVNALPISRSVQGNHPYWPTYDRVMADEFFRPYFTQGLFGGGEVLPRLYYKWMTGNNLSTLNVTATQLTRDLNFGGSLTWMPTTGEFGPRGAFGDFEDHEKLATRFGVGWGFSRENRQSNIDDPPNNTTIRIADSLNLFDTGTLAEGVTLERATYHLTAADIGFKKRGFWIQGEGYYRLLDDFIADGPLPVASIRDYGFYVQASYMVIRKTVELYAGTSYVFSDYGRPKEFLGGVNWYPKQTRNYRLNLHVINVDRSPVSSTFGFYVGQLKGTIVAVGATAFY